MVSARLFGGVLVVQQRRRPSIEDRVAQSLARSDQIG